MSRVDEWWLLALIIWLYVNPHVIHVFYNINTEVSPLEWYMVCLFVFCQLLVESRSSDVDICDKVSPDIQLFPTLSVVFGSGGHHLREWWLLFGSIPSPTFLPHRNCRHQNAGSWFAAIYSQHFCVNMDILFHPPYYCRAKFDMLHAMFYIFMPCFIYLCHVLYIYAMIYIFLS